MEKVMKNKRLAKILKCYLEGVVFKAGLNGEDATVEEAAMGVEAFLLVASHGEDGFAHDFYVTGIGGKNESYNASKEAVCSALVHLLCLLGSEADIKGDKKASDVAWKMLHMVGTIDKRTSNVLTKVDNR